MWGLGFRANLVLRVKGIGFSKNQLFEVFFWDLGSRVYCNFLILEIFGLKL